jgi:hypothetical protein
MRQPIIADGRHEDELVGVYRRRLVRPPPVGQYLGCSQQRRMPGDYEGIQQAGSRVVGLFRREIFQAMAGNQNHNVLQAHGFVLVAGFLRIAVNGVAAQGMAFDGMQFPSHV